MQIRRAKFLFALPRVRTAVAALVAVAALGVIALDPGAIVAGARWVGYAVCHQWPEHSFAVAGQSLPLCARCTGTYFGALLALAFILATRRGKNAGWPPKSVLVLLGVGFAAMAVDGVNSFVDVFTVGRAHLYAPTNALRFLTGGMNGIAITAIAYPLMSYVLWKDWKDAPVLANVHELAILVAGLLVGLAAVNVSSEATLIAFSVLTLIGVFAVFGGINAALAALVARAERSASRLREVALPFAAGLGLTAAELLAIGLLRNLLEHYAGMTR
jgi:uncharacterized membrane protein